MKKIITIIILIAIVAGVSFFYYKNSGHSNIPSIDTAALESLKTEKPETADAVDELKKAYANFNKDEVQAYSILGLAFKSVGDMSNDKSYYQDALVVYELAIDKTERKNTLFILNAGNMARELGDYEKAKKYYEEATYVAPGDIEGYQKLIELHMYQLKSDKNTIIEIFDRGINRMLDKSPLTKWKESYIKSLEENGQN